MSKPKLTIGIHVAIVGNADFTTGENRQNAALDTTIGFGVDVLVSTRDKLYEAYKLFCDAHGMELVIMDRKDIMNFMDHTKDKSTLDGLFTKDGRIIDDEDAVETLWDGRSINN